MPRRTIWSASRGREPVDELPDGLGTLLGPYIGGRSLSGGQWQRLALARGLMRDQPQLIVLDEPTASLIVMDEGTVVETGDHASLMVGQGVYAELFTLQAAGYA